ncbi:MAG TPA: sulfite reductase subunit alpha [Burkholderiales bacterium]|jgi:sulfite reductase (NADPH) flavoprotein alpha-component
MQALIPENAPFSVEQRAWLNGFVTGLLGMERAAAGAGSAGSVPAAAALAGPAGEEFPWHDPTIALDERMKLAADRPLELRLMAAMGQLDCGQCGYECRSYAAAIAAGAESELGKCVPGGRETAKKIKELVPRPAGPRLAAPGPAVKPEAAVIERGYGRDAPVSARLISSALLSLPGAEKETRHVAIDVTGCGLQYTPGDSLGVWPHNNPDEVELLIAILRARGSEAVTLPDGAVVSAREALGCECDLRAPGESLYALLAREAKDEADRARLSKLADDDGQADALGVHDVLDALLEFPSARPRIDEFVAALGRMQPRLYSIASSQKRHPREVHLTVGMLRYERNDRAYRGTGSSFLSEHLRPGRAVSVFVQRAHGFRLPADLAAHVIMVGPGTGIAPFRAFLQERAAAGAAGRNWLFFGNQRREADFLYRSELEDFAEKRLLSRMDLAFSRDQLNKVYVQHKMLEAAQELWRWLSNGAYLYVCGEAKRMAGDVDLALQQIAVTQGGMDAAAAKRFLQELVRAGRYQRDVY